MWEYITQRRAPSLRVRGQGHGRGRHRVKGPGGVTGPSRKNVQKVGGYHTKKLRRSQLLLNPMLGVPITLSDARGHDALASAKIMDTSNIGLRSK